MKIIKRQQTIEKETGELLHETEYDMVFYLYNDSAGYVLYNNRTRVHVFPNIKIKLTTADKSRAWDLMRMIDKCGRVVMSEPDERTGSYMVVSSKLEFASALGISTAQAYRFLKRAEDANLIRRHNKVFYVNPLLMMNGSRLPHELYAIFSDQLDPYLPEWVIQRYKLKLKGEQ
jgi:hypothetical protein